VDRQAFLLQRSVFKVAAITVATFKLGLDTLVLGWLALFLANVAVKLAATTLAVLPTLAHTLFAFVWFTAWNQALR